MNPMSEYLLKLQLIVTNTEFKNRFEANKYETLQSHHDGDMYVRACEKTDIFESYDYERAEVISVMQQHGYSDSTINKAMINPILIPIDVKNELLEIYRQRYIDNYVEQNPYYCRLSGVPFQGNDTIPADEVIRIPDEFYEMYYLSGEIYRREPIHLMPDKYIELFINASKDGKSLFYEPLLAEYPDLTYLKYIGSYAIPIAVSRKAQDGEIMRINQKKLNSYNSIYGNISVEASIIHEFNKTYGEVRKYVFDTLRGNFAQIYPNYDSFIRFLTIYMAMGQSMNMFMHKSSSMIYMNTITANDFFSLYGLPSVIMEGSGMIKFLKNFRKILMDKGTNICYRVKDLIGYEYTDIYTLVMVKQQVFDNGKPVFIEDPDNPGKYIPKQNIYFRRFGTTADNTSYFKYRESNKSYTVEEITSGDPRWWNTPEVERMLEDMNYTLSNSKYIQLSTHLSFTDIWWDLTIFLRGILDNRDISENVYINTNYSINNSSSLNLFDAVLSLIILMQWHLTIPLKNSEGKIIGYDTMRGDMYLPNRTVDGRYVCVDLLFNGLNPDGSPIDLKLGNPFQVASFDFDVRTTKSDWYNAIENMGYLGGLQFKSMLDNILDNHTNNIGVILKEEVRLLYKYLERKLVECWTISQYREVTDAYRNLFLVDPIRDWYANISTDIDQTIMDQFDIPITQYTILKESIFTENTTDVRFTYNDTTYPISFYNILNKDCYSLQINNEYPFQDNAFVEAFSKFMSSYKCMTVLNSERLNNSVKSNFSNIIIDKVMLDVGSSDDGPRTFEALLFKRNPSLYRYLFENKTDSSAVVLIIRAIIKGLEEYSNSSLAGLYYTSLGQEEYFRILKEVISYFKSYMVEFTKDEFVYLFDGVLDNGGNSNMCKMLDEVAHTTLRIKPRESMGLYDIAHFNDDMLQPDEETVMYDQPVFRLRGTIAKLNTLGYDVWYDDGKRLFQNPTFKCSQDTVVVANVVQTKPKHENDVPPAYKIIINVRNLAVIPPNYYGNVK